MSENKQFFLCACAGYATLFLFGMFLQNIGAEYPLESIARQIEYLRGACK